MRLVFGFWGVLVSGFCFDLIFVSGFAVDACLGFVGFGIIGRFVGLCFSVGLGFTLVVVLWWVCLLLLIGWFISFVVGCLLCSRLFVLLLMKLV